MATETLKENLQRVRKHVREAAIQHGRTPPVILAVSKTRSADDIRTAYAAGQRAFGENYLQEAAGKIVALQDLRHDLEWHFIGAIQSNKTSAIAELFDWVHTVDRLRIAERLARQRPPALQPLNVCVQVNIDDEDSKAGIAPAEVMVLADAIGRMPTLTLRGLMCIPRPQAQADTAAFARMETLFREVAARLPDGNRFDTLSMGMSDDYAEAIAHGSTLVRIGTALFGARSKPTP